MPDASACASLGVEMLTLRRLRVAGLPLATLLVFCVQPGAAAKPSPCGYPRTNWSPYHWPVKPFDRQHPVRAAFGDPRTLNPGQSFGQTGPHEGAASFHNGIDIAAAPGTAVYPVVSGRVVIRGRNDIVVRADDGRSFQYDELDRAVHTGQIVAAEQTVLGWIRPGPVFEHVHLAEIDAEWNGLCRVHNPLDPGHLEPYRDHTTPRVTGLYLDTNHGPLPLDGPIRPHDRLEVAAADQAAQPLSGRWLGLPQAPALVEWRLFHAGAYTPWHIVVDFRKTEPPPRNFWSVYAPGTYQNRPVFAHRLFQTPGRYLFRLSLNPGTTVRPLPPPGPSRRHPRQRIHHRPVAPGSQPLTINRWRWPGPVSGNDP
jgi:Peptidase family M23